MSDKKQANTQSRRDFLRKAAVGTGVAAAAAAAPKTVLASPIEEASEPKASKGYRLSRHILDYYKSASE